MKPGERSARNRVGEARQNALRAMKDSGFAIDEDVRVEVDPKLPFMGYTRPQGDGFQIVVSGMAVNSGMLEGLLIHEMSHVYRMRTNHPSHDGRIISEVLDGLGKRALSEEYRRKILHDLVNHIQDLYADDVSLAVMKVSGYVSRERLAAFFQDWVTATPVSSGDASRDAWVNASLLVNNARAIGQMERHGLKDVGGRAATSARRFLSGIPPAASGRFAYFTSLLRTLKADTTEGDYRSLLEDYLKKFLETVVSIQTPSRAGPSEEELRRQEIDEWASEPPMHGGD